MSSYSSSVVRSRSATANKLVGDSMSRKETYTPPRTVTLNTKYEGAAQIDVWTGYAVLVVDKNGNRKTVVGPQTILLEFDQQLASMEFSTGKPKTTERLYKTAFLRVLNNQVSDVITAQTSDDISVQVKTSYRVNFIPESQDKWFNAENYVKLLCDHVRSKVRNTIKKLGIQQFTDNYIDIVRDTVLGVGKTDTAGAKTPRPGLKFDENGAHVYDVEILGLEIGDRTIAEQLLSAQRQTIQDALKLATSKRQLVLAEEQETINQKLESLRTDSQIQKAQLQKQVLVENAALTLAEIGKDEDVFQAKQQVEVEKQKVIDISNAAELKRNQAGADQQMEQRKASLELTLQELNAETTSVTERIKAITPDLVTALQAFGDKALLEKITASMAPLAILGGSSVQDVVVKMLKGTGLDKLANVSIGTGNGNGTRDAAYNRP
jgi:major vault protein